MSFHNKTMEGQPLAADLPLAEFLIALGHWPKLVPVGGDFFSFHFTRTPEIEDAATRFSLGDARIEPRTLRVAQYRLRRALEAARRTARVTSERRAP